MHHRASQGGTGRVTGLHGSRALPALLKQSCLMARDDEQEKVWPAAYGHAHRKPAPPRDQPSKAPGQSSRDNRPLMCADEQISSPSMRTLNSCSFITVAPAEAPRSNPQYR